MLNYSTEKTKKHCPENQTLPGHSTDNSEEHKNSSHQTGVVKVNNSDISTTPKEATTSQSHTLIPPLKTIAVQHVQDDNRIIKTASDPDHPEVESDGEDEAIQNTHSDEIITENIAISATVSDPERGDGEETLLIQIHHQVIEAIIKSKDHSFRTEIRTHKSMLYFIAMICSLSTGTLHFSLTWQDKELRRYGRPMVAGLNGFLEFIQSIIVINITAERYYHNILHLPCPWKTQQIKQLLQLPDNATCISVTWRATKKLFRFLFKESTKWTALVYSSALPASLVKEVKWLQFPFFIYYVNISYMLLLEPAVEELIQQIPSISLSTAFFVQMEKNNFRKSILTWMAAIAKNKTNNTQTIDTEHDHTYFFNTHLIGDQQKILSQLLSQTQSNVIQPALISILSLVYSASNTSLYKAIWENHTDSYFYRTTSIVGDMLFGFFMANRAIHHIDDSCNNYFLTFCRYEWKKFLICAAGLLLAFPTIFTTLSVNEYEHLCTPMALALAALGTIFDNAYFLIETGIQLENRRCYKNKNLGIQYQRAAQTLKYDKYFNTIKTLSDAEFLKYIEQLYRTCPELFESYVKYFHKKLPWARTLDFDNILILMQQPNQMNAAIRNSKRCGLSREIIEIMAMILSMSVCSGYFIPTQNKIIRILLHDASSLFAIPSACIFFKLFDYCESKKNTEEYIPLVATHYFSLSQNPAEHGSNHPEQHNENQENRHSKIKKNSTLTNIQSCAGWIYNTALPWAGYILLPLSSKYIIKISSEWFFKNAFKVPPEQAEQYGTWTGNFASYLSTGYMTKKMGMGLR